MATLKTINISDLKLDLRNPRILPAENEEEALKGIYSYKPQRFEAVLESILTSGYLSENLIVLDSSNGNIVKEGNRRVCCLKLAHNILDPNIIELSNKMKEMLKNVTEEWKKENAMIPCHIFDETQIDQLKSIVTRTHGKNQGAAQLDWSSVAKARYNRDELEIKEPTLDLLEKYLKQGENISKRHAVTWSTDYNLSVLDELVNKFHKNLGLDSKEALIQSYPNIKKRAVFETIMYKIGIEQVGFPTLRAGRDNFITEYSLDPDNKPEDSQPTGKVVQLTTPENENSGNNSNSNNNQNQSHQGQGGSTNSNDSDQGDKSKKTSKPTPKPPAIKTQANVRNCLKKLNVHTDSPKVQTLKEELLKIQIKNNPIAFCFVVRSTFEISAKNYCLRNNIPFQKNNGDDKSLKDVLNIAFDHLTNNGKNLSVVRTLHGAKLDLLTPDRPLSITSMNQLVHNPSFSMSPGDVCIWFNNIFPMLDSLH